MPYRRINELPSGVRVHLPEKAQHIYLRVFNNAWETYADEHKRRESANRDETAHRVAWAAVKNSYFKDDDGRWKRIKRTDKLTMY